MTDATRNEKIQNLSTKISLLNARLNWTGRMRLAGEVRKATKAEIAAAHAEITALALEGATGYPQGVDD